MTGPETRQLPLELETPPALGRGDFLVAPANALAVEMLDACAGWPQGRLLLIGPEGSGKSHLAAIIAGDHGASTVAGADLRPDDAPALLQGGMAVIDDADAVAGDPEAERALFHLWNLSAQQGAMLLLTARTPPRDWGIVLPDLHSRMQSMAAIRLGPPDEALLGAVLVKLFADRQVAVPPGLIDWLLPRMDRDLGLARRLVTALDREALAEKRPVTRKMTATLLDKLMSHNA